MPHTIQSPLPISDYCAAIQRHEIMINHDYQRSDKVWPPAARSFLIESILLGFPIPKIYLFQKTDLKSKKSIKEIVDGQQRTRTINDFFTNKLRISTKSAIAEARGKNYDQLDDDLKGKFLNYQLSVDLFVSATPNEIRQAFRRLNSYTVPLNPEEKRHAEYQGAFKWFVHKLTGDYEEAFLSMGVFGEKQIIRMQDTKLVTEITHSLLNGIQTTKSKQLDDVYKNNDGEFLLNEEIQARLINAFDWIATIDDVHRGPLMAPHIFYSLVLAVTHAQHPWETLQNAFQLDQAIPISMDIATANLTALAEALQTDPPPKNFEPFVIASGEGANVLAQRKARFEWLCRALEPKIL